MDAIIPILPSTKFCPLPGKRARTLTSPVSAVANPTIFYRNISGVRWIREKYRKYVERRTRRHMPKEFIRYQTRNIDDIFNVGKFGRQRLPRRHKNCFLQSSRGARAGAVILQ